MYLDKRETNGIEDFNKILNNSGSKKERINGKVTKDNSDLADESVVGISESNLPSTPEFSLINEQSDSEFNPKILKIIRSSDTRSKDHQDINILNKRKRYFFKHKSNCSMELIKRSLIKRKISTNARWSSPDSFDNDNHFHTNDESQVAFKNESQDIKTTQIDLIAEVNRLSKIIQDKELMHSKIIGKSFIINNLGDLIQIKNENNELRKYLNYFMQLNNFA